MLNGLFSPISFLNISDYRLQARLFMGWWKDVSNCLYWLHISGSRIMNMLAFSLWHCCLIDITLMWLPCASSHTLDLFLQPFSLILCEKNIEIWIILFSPWIILLSPYSWHFSMFYVCFVHKYFTYRRTASFFQTCCFLFTLQRKICVLPIS